MARYVNCRSTAIQDDNLAGSNHLGSSSANRTLSIGSKKLTAGKNPQRPAKPVTRRRAPAAANPLVLIREDPGGSCPPRGLIRG